MTTLEASRYELLEVAGEGGMATVWRGVVRGAAGFARPIAVKRILPQLLDDKQFVTMFIEEARVGSELQHPNIVQILDFGCDDEGVYFMVMEWVEGIDLSRFVEAFRLVGRPTPWPLIVTIAIEALRGLSSAHTRVNAEDQLAPVIHRDVTPHNILISTQGLVKLTDFGLSWAKDRGRITHPDIVKGKVSYLAPELSHGAEATPQSDLFSMGVVLWETLAGRSLFEGESDVEVVLNIRKSEVPPLREVRSDIPETLERTVQRALASDPALRQRSGLELLRDLTAIVRQVGAPTDSQILASSVREVRQMLDTYAPDRAAGPGMPRPEHAGPGRPPPPPVPVRPRTDVSPVEESILDLSAEAVPVKPTAENETVAAVNKPANSVGRKPGKGRKRRRKAAAKPTKSKNRTSKGS